MRRDGVAAREHQRQQERADQRTLRRSVSVRLAAGLCPARLSGRCPRGSWPASFASPQLLGDSPPRLFLPNVASSALSIRSASASRAETSSARTFPSRTLVPVERDPA